MKQCLWWCHRFWNPYILQKHKNLDISRTKHCFFFKLITHQGLLYRKKYLCSSGNLQKMKENTLEVFCKGKKKVKFLQSTVGKATFLGSWSKMKYSSAKFVFLKNQLLSLNNITIQPLQMVVWDLNEVC